MNILKITVSFLCLTLAGCLMGPDYQRPVIFENAELEKTLDLKVPPIVALPFSPKDFKDKELNALIAEAKDNAPDIRTAMARLEAGRATRLGTIAGLFPTLDASEQHTDQSLSENMGLMPDNNYYQAGLSVAWELDLFGKKRREIEEASATEAQMKAALENVMVSVVAEVGLNYVSLRTAQYLLKQTKDDLKIQKELARLTRDKYKSGLSSAIDVNQAEYQVATTQANIPKLETQIEIYKNALAVLVGKPAGSLHKRLKMTDKNLIVHPFRFDLKKLQSLPVDVIRYRPDVIGVEQALKAQNARVGQAVASLFPTVSLSAIFGFESIHFDNLFESNSHAHSYRSSITAPLFHFGALWQNVKAEEAHMKQSLIQYEKTLLNATEEIRNILVGLQKMEARHKDLQNAWKKMDKAARLARNRYESGLIDYFQVLNAEERRIAAQAALTMSSGDLYQNILNFYKAVGGQFTFDRIQASKSTN